MGSTITGASVASFTAEQAARRAAEEAARRAMEEAIRRAAAEAAQRAAAEAARRTGHPQDAFTQGGSSSRGPDLGSEPAATTLRTENTLDSQANCLDLVGDQLAADPQLLTESEVVFLRDTRSGPEGDSGHVVIRRGDQLWDPATGQWSSVSGFLQQHRYYQVAGTASGQAVHDILSARPGSERDAAIARANIDPALVDMPVADPFDPDRARSAIRTAARDNAVIPEGVNMAEAEAIREDAANAALAKYDAYLAAQPANLSADERARRAAVLTRADLISERAMAGETDFSRNEYLILFEAVELRTGIPADILKAYTFGESQARYYQDPYSRQFLEPEDQYQNMNGDGYPLLWTQAEGGSSWPTIQVNGQQVPVIIGWDGGVAQDARTTEDTLGLGITQLTFPTSTIAASVEVYQDGERIEGTAADPFPNDTSVTLQMPDIDIARVVQDPYYNLMVFANLTLYKAEQVYPDTMPSTEEVQQGVGLQETPFGTTMLTTWPELEAAQPDWALMVAYNKGWTEEQARAFHSGEKTAEEIYREIADGFLALIDDPDSTEGLTAPVDANQPRRDYSFLTQSPDLYSPE